MGVKLPKGFCKLCAARCPPKNLYCESCRPASKYKNVKVGRVASKKEAERGNFLASLLSAGVVRNLEAQVSFRLEVNGMLVATYVADFVYEICENGVWRRVIEDVKGYRTRYYKLKAKLFLACMGFPITEV